MLADAHLYGLLPFMSEGVVGNSKFWSFPSVASECNRNPFLALQVALSTANVQYFLFLLVVKFVAGFFI